MSLLAAVSIVATDYVQASLLADDPYPMTVAVGWLSTWIPFPVLALGMLLLLTFPAGHLPAGRWRLVAAAGTTAAGVAAVCAALTPGPLPISSAITNPLGIDGAGGVLEAVSGLASLVMAVGTRRPPSFGWSCAAARPRASSATSCAWSPVPSRWRRWGSPPPPWHPAR